MKPYIAGKRLPNFLFYDVVAHRVLKSFERGTIQKKALFLNAIHVQYVGFACHE
jgi:hypothetical protein